MFKTTTSEPVFSKIPSVRSLDTFESLVTDYGTSFSPIYAFTTEILAPVPLPVGKTIFDVFKSCFDDDAPVLPEYNNERNYTDQKYSKWRGTADGGSFCGQRVFDCTSVIRAMMNKQCHLTQYEKYAFYKVNDKSVLMIQTSGQISNVMLADAFRVESLITFTQTNNMETDSATVVMMHVRSHIHFFRSVLLKGKIVSNANSELKEGMKKLLDLLSKALQSSLAVSQTPKSISVTREEEGKLEEAAVNIVTVDNSAIDNSSDAAATSTSNKSDINTDDIHNKGDTLNEPKVVQISQTQNVIYLLSTCVTAFIVLWCTLRVILVICLLNFDTYVPRSAFSKSDYSDVTQHTNFAHLVHGTYIMYHARPVALIIFAVIGLTFGRIFFSTLIKLRKMLHNNYTSENKVIEKHIDKNERHITS